MLRAAVILLGLAAYAGSRGIVPLYAARPPVLLDGAGVAWGAFVPSAVGLAVFAFGVVFLAESALYRRLLRVDLPSALRENLRTYTPFSIGVVYALLFFPGLSVVPMFVWWLLLDGSPWLLTIVALATLARKRALFSPGAMGRLTRPVATGLLAVGLLGLMLLWTPHRRFSEPYDERWGTGDEPRYVRLAASLLHDGDADIENADEHVGERASFGRFLLRAAHWVPATFATGSEAARATFGRGRPGRARTLGGPVIEGRRGGVYYSFLPGFPLLLVPSMALDSVLDPGYLVVTLLTCMLLAIVLVLLLERLVEPVLDSVSWASGLAAVIAFSLPLFLYFFQVYTEVPAAIGLTLALGVLMQDRPTFASALVFGLACGYLPWLHGKYLPLWGVAVCAYAVKTRFRRETALGLGLAGLGLVTNCLYVFDITGSLLPDTLWTLRGYERGASLLSCSTLPGLHHLFLSRAEGLFVYAPQMLLVLPGLFALRKRSRFAFWTSVGLIVPYVLAAASHDQGGAGAWSPPARYLVPLLPVFALALAAWLEPAKTRRLRFSLLLASASASFWMAQAMLAERNFPYDRAALLASGFLDPSPVLTSSFYGLGVLLASGLAALLVAMRRGWLSGSRVYGGVALATLLMGCTTAAWTRAAEWVPAQRPTALRLHSTRSRLVQLLDCPAGGERLRFRGTGDVHAVSLRGPGLRVELRVPSGTATELPVDIQPIRYWTRMGRKDYRIVAVSLGADERPVDVEAVCR